MSNALAIAAVAGILMLTWVLLLYRKRRLNEDQALVWISVSVLVVLLSTWTDLLIFINQLVAASKVSDVVLAAFVALLIIVSIYYSVKISDLTNQNRRMAQEIAVMKSLDANDLQRNRAEGRD